MNPYIEIAGRKIGPDFPPLAEIGINMKVLGQRNG
jgi:N-acetylneuraminate synthase